MTAATFLLILFSVSLNATAQILLRKAMTIGARPPLSETLALGLSLISNVWLWAGMMAYAVSIGSWLAVLSRVQVSMAYPMLSVGYVIAAFLGIMFLGESIGMARWGGIVLICLGVVLVARTA